MRKPLIIYDFAPYSFKISLFIFGLAVKADDDILVNPERLVEIMEDKYPGMNNNIWGNL